MAALGQMADPADRLTLDTLNVTMKKSRTQRDFFIVNFAFTPEKALM